MSSIKIKDIFWFLAAVYAVLAVISAVFQWRNMPDAEWIVEVTRAIPTLRPWAPYRHIAVAPPLGSSVNYPPVFFLLLYPFVSLGDALGWTTERIAAFYSLPFVLVDILCIYLTLDLLRRLGKRVRQPDLVFTSLVLFFSGYFLYATVFIGHPETLLLAFSLLAIRALLQGRLGWSGVLWGFGLATKQTTLFLFLPVVLMLGLGKKRTDALKLCIGASLVFAGFILPFFLAYPRDTLYDIFGVNHYLVIRGANIWWLLDAISKRLLFSEAVTPLLTRLANPVLLGVFVSGLLSFIRGTRLTARDERFWGVLLYSLLTFHVFAKWINFYHFLPGFVIFLLWDGLRRQGFPTAAVVYAFVLLVAYFFGHPAWQLWVLAINVGAWGYVIFSLAGRGVAVRPR